MKSINDFSQLAFSYLLHLFLMIKKFLQRNVILWTEASGFKYEKVSKEISLF